MTDERLARALDVFLHCQDAGVGRDDAVAAHPDLVDLLGPLFDGDARGPEEMVFGDYRVVREVGRGGVGVVYEAVQRSLGRRVALKVLGEVAGLSAVQVARLRREALAMAQVQHAHVVRVHDVGETGGRHWLAMDFVDGGTLADRIRALRDGGGHQGASLRQVVEMLATIAEALEHVHRQGIVHRDVKPSNILLRADGTPLLSDFGLARNDAAPTVTVAGAIAGTPQYMSPEHLAGHGALVPASDVFSLGATLYEAVALQAAFPGGTTEAVLQRILLQPTPDVRRQHRSLPRDLAAILGKALEKDLARRYPSAGALAEDLRAFLDLRPVRARLPSMTRRSWQWLRREPLRAVLLASLSLVMLFAVLMVAQWPSLEAAAAASRERDYEATLERAWARRWTAPTESREAFRRLPQLKPGDSEAVVQCSLGLRSLDGDDAALTALESGRGDAADGEVIDRARVLLLQLAGRREDAAAQAAAMPPPSTSVGLWLAGSTELALAGADATRARRALEWISLAVRLSPTPRLPLVLQWVVAAVTAGDHDAMREAQRTLLELWPEHPLALHHAARALQELDPERALQLCRRGRELGMEEELSRWWEYVLCAKLAKPESIVAAARACLDCTWDPKKRTVLLNALVEHGDADGAKAAAEAWLARDPDNPQARFFVAQSTAANYPERSLDLLADLVEVAPDFAAAQHALARLQLRVGQRAAAADSLRRAIAARPDFEPAHVTLVELLELEHDRDGRLAEWQRWVALVPDDVAAQAGLAVALRGVHPPRLVEALAAARRADELAGGKAPAVLELCASLHAALGETVSAEHCRQRAAQLRAR